MSKKIQINNKEEKIEPLREFNQTEVTVIPGKVVSIIKKNAVGEEFIVDDPKVVIGKRKGFLAAIGLIKKEKFIGIINKKGELIQDKNTIDNVLSNIKGYKFKDLNEKFVGRFDQNGELPKNLKFDIDQNIIVSKDNKLVAIQEKSGLINQYGTSLYREELVKENNKSYLISESGRGINTQKGIENLKKQPTKSTLKVSTEATRIGKNLNETLLKRKKEDQQAAKDIAANARKAKNIGNIR